MGDVSASTPFLAIDLPTEDAGSDYDSLDPTLTPVEMSRTLSRSVPRSGRTTHLLAPAQC